MLRFRKDRLCLGNVSSSPEARRIGNDSPAKTTSYTGLSPRARDDVPRRGGEVIFGGVSLGQPQKMLVGSSLISLRSSSTVLGSVSS
jgi:hypothetical protein